MQDFIPVVAFIGAYVSARVLGYAEQAMYVATAALMLVSAVQLLWMKLRNTAIEKRHWLTV